MTQKIQLTPGIAPLILSTESAPAPMALFDSGGRIAALSPAWTRLTGLRIDDVRGQTFAQACPDAPAERLALHRRAMAGEHLVNDEESFEAGGDQTWMCCEYRPLKGPDGQTRGYFVHGHDITPLMQARRDAQVNAERLSLALGAARAGVCEVDIAGRGIWCSPGFAEIVGTEVTDFRRFAREPWWMAHDDDKPAIEAAIRDWDGPRHRPLDFRVVLPTGQTRWVQIHGEQQVDAEGRRTKIVGLILDIDDRKRQELALVQARLELQQNAERLSLALDAAQAGVFESDFKAGSFWCSPEFVAIVGRPLTFEESLSAWPMTHPDDAALQSGVVERAQAGERQFQMEWRIVHENGEHRWIDARCTVHVDENGLPSKIAGLVLDVDARKQQELALVEAERAAQAAAEAKSQFLANMSHEIRTPMNGVLGVLHLLQRETLSEEGRQLLAEASNCGRMLSQLLDDVIDFSRIEAGRLELSPEPIDPAQVLESVAGLLRPSATAKGLQLRTKTEDDGDADGGWISADPVRLRQALFNLIGNAVKFTRAGHVEVRLTARPDGDRRRLRFEIEDTGVGIPDAVQASLFRRFQQADGSTSRQFGGSGLGLAITRRLAELMDGDVGFESAEGKGSTFWFEITAEQARRTDPGDDCPAPLLDGMRILLVEDNPTNRLVASKMLEAMGVSVSTAEHGAHGVEAARQELFDLILMDVQMPVMDGVEATRCIRAMGGETGATPIIGLTANAMAHQRETYLAAGMNGVAAKPISPAALVAEIARVLTEDAQRAEAAA